MFVLLPIINHTIKNINFHKMHEIFSKEKNPRNLQNMLKIKNKTVTIKVYNTVRSYVKEKKVSIGMAAVFKSADINTICRVHSEWNTNTLFLHHARTDAFHTSWVGSLYLPGRLWPQQPTHLLPLSLVLNKYM